MVASSNPGNSGGRIFFSRVNFVCWLLFGVRSTPVLPQWHVKDPGHSARSAYGRLHFNTHTPITQRSRSGLTMPLSRHSAEPIPKRVHTQLVREHSATVVSAHWAIVDWSWHKEWNQCARANLHFNNKKRKKERKKNKKGHNRRTTGRTSHRNPRKRGKRHHECSPTPTALDKKCQGKGRWKDFLSSPLPGYFLLRPSSLLQPQDHRRIYDSRRSLSSTHWFRPLTPIRSVIFS